VNGILIGPAAMLLDQYLGFEQRGEDVTVLRKAALLLLLSTSVTGSLFAKTIGSGPVTGANSVRHQRHRHLRRP
jgi:hypothetical protein